MIEEKMKEVLKKRGILQKEAAKMLGITPGEMSHWFVGRNNIKAEDVKKFCEVFDTTPNYLMGFEDDITESDRQILRYVKSAVEKERNSEQDTKNTDKQIQIPSQKERL